MNILRLALLSLAAVIALALGTHLLLRASRMSTPPSPPLIAEEHPSSSEKIAALRQHIEAEFAQSPDYARFFDHLKQTLPSEYNALLDELVKRGQTGVSLSNIDFLMSDAVRFLRLSRGIVAAKADAPALKRIFDAQLDVLHALAGKDPRLCVDFLYGGASEGFFAFSAEHRPLVTELALAGLDAIEDGATKKVTREPPNDTDFDLLEQALKQKGLNKAEIEALLDGKTTDSPIPDARMCDIGQIYLETLKTLPEPVKLRIYGLAVELMARS